MVNLSITDDDFMLLARTLFGEARGEEHDGKKAVAMVIFNRVKAKSWYGRTVREVILKPWQFSAWNENDPNRNQMEYEKITSSKALRRCVKAVLDAIEDNRKGVDITHGSTHYHAGFVRPQWSEGKTPAVLIGGHVFYNDIE